MTGHDAHALAGAYALDALTEAERRAFEDHLEECGPCAEEARGLADAAAELGVTAGLPAPPQLRGRVMDSIGRVSQLPAHLVGARPRRRTGARLPVVTAAACVATAAFLAATLVSGGLLLHARDDLQRAEAARQQVASVLAAPDARAASAPVSTGGTGTVIVSRTQGRAVVIVSGLTGLPSARAYELWQLGPKPPVPAGLISASGRQVLVVLRPDAQRIGMTVEAAGGARAPTTPPVLELSLPS